MSRVVIADTTCLIAFDHIGKPEILKSLFGSLVVTNIVSLEYGGPLPTFIQIQNPENKNVFNSILSNLDEGEASSIALAVEIPNSLLIIDEKKGRKVALDLGLNIIGTLRIILEAKNKGHITSVREVLDLLKSHKFRFSNSVTHEILKLANEL